MQTPISIVIITKNEESILGDCLNAINWCKDIVIVDSGSTDKTLEIAEKHNCRVFHRDFDGFGEQKQYAVSLAKNDWVLNLDADEILDNELQNSLKNFKPTNGNIVGYKLQFLMIFLNRPLKWWSRFKKETHVRLFNKNFGTFDESKVHEKIQLKGNIGTLKGKVKHFSYRSLFHFFEKLNQYTSIASDGLFERNKKTSTLVIYLKTVIQFVQIYIFQGAFLDGFAGFSWAYCSSVYKAVKYIKLKEHYIK